MRKFLKWIKSILSRNVRTVENFTDYKCKGICHQNMRCVDLPDHERTCTADDLVLTKELIAFLKEEIKKEVEDGWAERTANLIKSHPDGGPVPREHVRRCC